VTSVFTDTSALLALLVGTDESHQKAREVLVRLQSMRARLVTTSYVLVETYALVGKRFGPASVETFRNDLAPLLSVEWVGSEWHEAGLDLLREKSSRQLSLVDAVSFVCMRERRLTLVFAFDPHFIEEGHETV
jgi:predicted nucleic acid-binding protein